MRAPFSCDIDGVKLQVTPDDAAMMFDKTSLLAMNKVLVIGGGNREPRDRNEPPKKERRNTAAAETGLGLGCNRAHFETDRRDRTQNVNARATQLKQDLKEKDAIIETLAVFEKRKNKYLEAVRRQRENTSIGCLIVPFWVCRETESDNKVSFRLFLRMFLPRYGHGYLGKTTAFQWETIRDKIQSTVDLTESSVNAKAEELRRRLRTVEQAIQDLQQNGEDTIPTAG